jgi:D-tyrosyl-tRNA(Tyr) deacylase
MKIVIQRVLSASVLIQQGTVSEIQRGFLVLLGIHNDDTKQDVEYLVKKLMNLRVFPDESGKMNLSLTDIDGQILLVSQFTLYADTKRGNRPSFIESATPDKAVPLYQLFIELLNRLMGQKIKTGVFGADMKISLVNDGPVTVIIDSKN